LPSLLAQRHPFPEKTCNPPPDTLHTRPD
jgi:hypothetical protein